jgi:putative oxidoreductase
LQLLVAWGELVGGVVLLLGFLTRWAALALILIQVGAICMVTGARGFAPTGETGYEYNVALVAMCLALVVLGGGTLALNRLFWRSPQPAPGTPPPAPAPEPTPALR